MRCGVQDMRAVNVDTNILRTHILFGKVSIGVNLIFLNATGLSINIIA